LLSGEIRNDQEEAKAKKISEEHGGSIRAENRPVGGAVFIVRLPRDAEAVRA